MKLSLHDQSMLYHELAKLTASGFGFDKSAELLLQQAPNRAVAAWLREVIQRLHDGRSIAESVFQPALGFHELDFQIIQSAEHGGVLETAFAYLRDFYSAKLRLHRTLVAKLLYPGLLLHLAIFLPAIPPLILGQASAAKLHASLLLLLAVYATAAIAYLAWKRILHSAANSIAADQILRKIPVLGKVHQLSSLQRFASVFRVSLLAAMRTSSALHAAGQASGSALLAREVASLARHAEQGSRLSTLLPDLRQFPDEFRRSLASAEVSGTLEQDLDAWSRSFGQDIELQGARLAILFPAMATFAVALFVAWRLIAVYFGVLNDQMKILDGLW